MRHTPPRRIPSPRHIRAARRLLALTSVAVTGVVLITGCGGTNGNGTAPSNTPGSSTASSHPASNRPGQQQALAAAATAARKVPSGTVTSVDAEHGGAIWEVKIITSGGVEHEVDVDRNGTKVVSGPRTKHEDAEDRTENHRVVRGAEVRYQAAAKKILTARAGRITELNLDEERGRVVWESDVHHAGTKYEVKIDAATGKILKNAPDRNGDDD